MAVLKWGRRGAEQELAVAAVELKVKELRIVAHSRVLLQIFRSLVLGNF